MNAEFSRILTPFITLIPPSRSFLFLTSHCICSDRFIPSNVPGLSISSTQNTMGPYSIELFPRSSSTLSSAAVNCTAIGRSKISSSPFDHFLVISKYPSSGSVFTISPLMRNEGLLLFSDIYWYKLPGVASSLAHPGILNLRVNFDCSSGSMAILTSPFH